MNKSMLRFLCFFLCLPLILNANDNVYHEHIDVNIYNGNAISSITFKVHSGSYNVFGGGSLLFVLAPEETCRIFVENRKISVRKDEQSYTAFSSIHLLAQGDNGVFNCNPSGSLRARNYDDNLLLSMQGNVLKLINRVALEKYVAAVVQAEGGIMQDNEFFKLQAVACRTYALRNIRRHRHEGFHMCDKVHCQVYNGKCTKQEIVDMTLLTKGFVIIDRNLNFITAAFHANCGGQTINSEDVWSLPASYMKSVRDTFCTTGRHANWSFTIKKDRFLDYLARTYNFPVSDSAMVQRAFSFSQNEGRRVYFLDMSHIHLKNIRAEFNLKSTFFSIIEDGDSLIFNGRGFGHGVGLCQEGAIQMIRSGFKYDEVIKFYFTDVFIISYEDVVKTTEAEN